MIKTKELGFSIKEKMLLEGFSHRFKKGQLTLILGENGAGKSTLIKLISGQLKPTTGSIHFNEDDLTNISLQALATQRAVLSQSVSFVFPMKVSDVVMLGRYPFFKEKPSHVDFGIVEQMMDRFHISSFRNRDYDSLSGGEKQRVQFARVFAQIHEPSTKDNPRVLFLDEPLTYLDIAHQIEFLNELTKEIKETRLTVIGVLHEVNLAARFADELILLKQGRLIAAGAVGEVLTEENLELLYGLKPKFTQGAKSTIIEF